MLEATRPFGAPVRAYVSRFITHGVAREPWQERAYWRLRREIFCAELGLFASADRERDEHDAQAVPIVAVAHSAGTPEEVVGVVRTYATADGVWYGGRLGVAPAYRVRPQVGTGLIAAAVATASGHGCERFLAHVLAENVAYFRRHGFQARGELDVCGRRHVLMEASLARAARRRAA